MAFADNWNIKSHTRCCCITRQPFKDGDVVYTALFPDSESSSYLRRDFSERGWKARNADDEPPFSFWKHCFEAPDPEEKEDPVSRETAEELFNRLMQEDSSKTETVRFILAAMLERQKLLKETDTRRTEDNLIRIYQHRKSGKVFLLKDPEISLSDIESVQLQVLELLDPAPAEDEGEELPRP